MICARRSPPFSAPRPASNPTATVLDEPAKEDLIATIQEEAERLNRFIANLLDMTRLEVGRDRAAWRTDRSRRHHRQRARPRGQSARRSSRRDRSRSRSADAQDRSGAVRAGAVQPSRQCGEIYARRKQGLGQGRGARVPSVRLDILDEGQGIPAEDTERIFDKFYRIQAADRKRAGTGLGLAICRGFVEAMGGIDHCRQSHRSAGRGLHDQAAAGGSE